MDSTVFSVSSQPSRAILGSYLMILVSQCQDKLTEREILAYDNGN